MLISHEYKFIYVKAVKVAGTSVESLLQKYCLPPHLSVDYNYAQKSSGLKSKYGIVGGRGPEVLFNSHMSPDDILKEFGDYDNYIKI